MIFNRSETMYYCIFLFIIILVPGCASSVDHIDKFIPHRLDGTIQQGADIEKFTKQTVQELDKQKKGMIFGVGKLVNNQYETTTYRSETPKNLNKIFESILTEIFDDTSHYQSLGEANCRQDDDQVNKRIEGLNKLAEKSKYQNQLGSPPTAWVDMVVSGEYSWHEKELEIKYWSASPIFTGGKADIDAEFGSYKSSSRAEVIATVENCTTRKKVSVKEKVDIFERNIDHSLYLFSNQFGIVWISKEKSRGSVNEAMEEALKVATLKAILLATGKTFDDIKKLIDMHKIILNSMSSKDKRLILETLEFSPTNGPVVWRNSNSGNGYTVTPIRTYYKSGKPCREFSVEAKIEGRIIKNNYTACREQS